eukprot:6212471-Pleurochrysis_carterae.AAC.3
MANNMLQMSRSTAVIDKIDNLPNVRLARGRCAAATLSASTVSPSCAFACLPPSQPQSTMSSSRRFESKLQSQRISEAKTQELQSYLKTDKMLGENFRSDDRVVAMRHNKEMMNATKEHFMQTQLEAAESSRMRGAQLRDQEERLVAAVASKKV